MKEWTGTANSIFVTHGASNHSNSERADFDYYATDPEAVAKLLKAEEFSHYIFEPACGCCHISKVLISNGFNVVSSDIVNRGTEFQTGVADFLQYCPQPKNSRDIITNPPYKFATEFAAHALNISQDGVKVAMFLKLTFLEGVKRKALFDVYPPKKIYIFRSRIDCWKNGEKPEKPSKAVCYAWFVWVKGFTGDPKIFWI